ncbi:MAG: ferredoxin [Cephaloticoccus sp.]|nr:ferredoxin [Cephaloticoccus sp.]MCF7759520.1 ferredoxin [Cephaloticoccus sp.]
MASLSDRLPQNQPGVYYVDSTCIDCDQCRVSAPDIFARDEDAGVSYVQRQPVSAEEIAQIEEVLAECATDSIGNDGV